MSLPPEDVTRTPDRRSSTQALFAAFRTLTGARVKSPPPSTSTAIGTPGAARPVSFASPHSADGSLQRISQVSQRKGQPITGGPPGLEELVAQVDRSHSNAERAAAVDKICRVLEEYPVRNTLGLWSVASDLLLPEQPDDVAELGYKLLHGCASLPTLSAIERSVFFDAASLRKNDRYFGKRLQVIAALTKGGRDIGACESSIIPFVTSSLDACFQASLSGKRKTNGKRRADNPTPEADNLARLFQYTIDLCRFNAKVLTDDDVEVLLRRATAICQEATQQSDVEHCIRLFDTAITYIHVPTSVIRPCMEVLCAIYAHLPDLKEQSWGTLSNLLKSHVGGAAVSSLLHTLHDGPMLKGGREGKDNGVYKRAPLQVIQHLLLEDGRGGLPTIPMPLLFEAVKAFIKEPDCTQERHAIKLINTVLDQAHLRALLLVETDLSDLIDIISICAERDEDRRETRGTAPDATTTTQDDAPFDEMRVSGPMIQNAEEAGGVPGTRQKAPKVKSASDRTSLRDPQDAIFKALASLDTITDTLDFVQKEAVIDLFLRLFHRLSDSASHKTINHLAKERYLNPGNGNWMQVCHTIVDSILKDSTRPRPLRALAIATLRDTYNTIDKLCTGDVVLQCSALLLDSIQAEDDIEILHELVDFSVHVADQASAVEFSDVVQLLKKRLDRPRPSPAAGPSASPSRSLIVKMDQRFGSPCNVITTAFVRLFTRSVVLSAKKTRILYETLRAVAGSEKYENDARLTAMKLLFRLRADSRHALFVSSSSEGQRIAAELCRTEETAVEARIPDESWHGEQGRSEDPTSWREQRKSSGSSPHTSLNRHTGRPTAVTGRVSKPIPPLWMYPGPKGLPEEPSAESSRVVFSHVNASEYPLNEDILDMEVTLWLELIISLLQKPPDWEIYSYVLVHLGPQLSNQALVRSCVVQLRMLRNVLCEQVRNASFHEPPVHTLLKKADVAVCLFHVLTVIISYHEYFEKSEDDDLVKAFLQGIVQWDRTSKWCIHALSVCCFEIPLSVGKSLDSIVQKMSQIITKPATAIHILEFLTSLARLPELYKNFREDEFKLVFGVCFRYLQHIRDHRDRVTSNTGHRTLRHSGPSRDFTASPDPMTNKTRSVEEDLPQYLYSLAYHVITFWFMALKMEDRPRQIPWITKNLYYTDASGRQIMEEQGQILLDIMNMVAHTDRDETVRDESYAKPGDGEIWKKTWVIGNGLITIETAARTGASLVTTRRPSGTRVLTLRPQLAPSPHHQVPITVGLSSEAFHASSYVDILPDDIFQTFYAPLDLGNTAVPLPDDDMTRRAITLLDKVATVDSYQVGVTYIGEGQTNERDIFMNSMGSPAYTAFLSDLGTLSRLKGANFNTGGLDTHRDADGEFTYCWRDRCMELVFHIPTMMPTNSDPDITYPSKKLHIGNDFVNIIFNDSGLPYNFNTFPSAFNYVHVVISPESRASFVDRRLDADPDGRNRYYKVQAIAKAGFPDISPAVETKILCGKHLAGYCRLIAINACVFSSVWSARDGGESISSWTKRLREIKRLRVRYGASDRDVHTAATSSSPSPVQSLSTPPPREQNGISPFQRMSVAPYEAQLHQ